jgi:hypothetical protein
MSTITIYRPLYTSSHALVIGINQYPNAPLGYARQDAEAVRDILRDRFAFPEQNITTLLDAEATRDRILSVFLTYAEGAVGPDDRLVIFFAGHGCTRSGRRGEIGYLVPVDGDPNVLSTLLRWDDLTRNADLIAAKHVLFLMDACYGGLAITRSLSPGSARFVRDMLQRYSRQVLTAGKADEVVADSGGPRRGHSVFTGHLLDALEGKAVSDEGIVSANAVMAYVYDRVSKDAQSRQSPHFGFLDGDGDLIMAAPILGALEANAETGADVLVQVPPDLKVQDEQDGEVAFVDRIKQLLSDPSLRIRLDDLVTSETRAALYAVGSNEFPVEGPVTTEEFASRLRRYEMALERLRALTVLLAHWSTEQQVPMLTKILTRMADANPMAGGTTVWLGLRWYPLLLLMYSGGVAALAADNFQTLAVLLNTKVGSRGTGRESPELIVSVVEGMLEVDRAEMFKRLPGYERNYVPRSEYLFKALQPELEDLLFLGSSYETLFDKFEVFFALAYADIAYQQTKHVWGPPGRFGWKGRRGGSDPYADLIRDAAERAGTWGPLRAGMFGASPERFEKIASEYRDKLLKALPWF